MTLRLPHAVTGVSLAVAAGVVVVGMAIAAVRMLPVYRAEPIDVIPAERTDLFLRNPGAADFADWSGAFPELTTVTPMPQIRSVAVLRRDDGTRATVTFLRKPGPAPAGAVEWGAYLVHAQPQEALALLGTDRPLRAALDGAEPDRTLPSAVFRWGAAPPDDPDAALLLRILGTSPFLIRTAHPDGTVSMVFPGTSLHSAPGDAPGIPGTLALRMGGLPAALDHAEESMGAAEQAILEGRMLRAVRDRLGGRVSLPYSLLPLLETDGTVVIAERGSVTQVVFGGTAGSEEDARTVFDGAAASFRAEIVPVTELRETFDDRFVWESVMADDTQLLAAESQENGWTMRLLEDRRTGRLLALALRDRRVLLSTDGILLRETLQAEATGSVFPGAAARGTVTQALAAMFGVDEGAAWELRIQGDLAVVRILPK